VRYVQRFAPASAGDWHDDLVGSDQAGRGVSRQGEEYQGGEILDPENGKTYRAKMKLEDGGKTLHVRGFIGISLLGRTQVWIREE
jgi:uncharacterized protein (DUF2147 family)